MKKNEIESLLREVRITGGCPADAADLREALGDRWAMARHELRQIRMGLGDDHVLTKLGEMLGV